MMASKKRPSCAQSPMTRLTQELSSLSYSEMPEGSSQQSSQPSLSQQSGNGEGIYCTPEYHDGDFCTPDDQVQELNWSQGSQDMQQDTPSGQPQQWSICPPTPDVHKRRKTKGGGGRQEKFVYNLDPLAEEDDMQPGAGTAPKKQQPAAPSKAQPAAPSKNARQTSLQSWFSTPSSGPSGGLLFAQPSTSSSQQSTSSSPPASPARENVSSRESASARHSFPQGTRRVGAAACNTNPFVRESLTEQERRTPSRPLPLMAGAQASRYLQEFEELRILGRGGAGEVYLARHRMDGCLYAVKRGQAVPRSRREKEALFVEVYAMAALASVPHVVRYYGAWYEHDQLHIQMEVCDCTLQERWGGRRADEATLVRVMRQLGAALEGVHAGGLAHLDIKAENVYCKGDAEFRLGDFGLSFAPVLRQEGREPMEGDGRYAAPEAVAGLSQTGPKVADLGKCDVFSLGATLLELAWGVPLSLEVEGYVAVREGGEVRLAGRGELLGGQVGLLEAELTRMLRPDPEERAGAAEVRRAGERLWRETAAGKAEARERGAGVEGGAELAALRAEVEELRRRNAGLEKTVEALNCSGIDVSLTSVGDDAEPFGSQESPSGGGAGGPAAATPPPAGLLDGVSVLRGVSGDEAMLTC